MKRLAMVATLMAAMASLVGAGCGSSDSPTLTASTTTAPPSTATVPSPSTTASPSPTATTAPPPPPKVTTTAPPTTSGHAVHVAEANNATTVHVARGATIVAVLSNTYWTFAPPSPAGILTEDGSPTVAPAPAGQCVPGEGCGTVTATYTATAAGTAAIAASRTTCGEALRCTGSNGSYSVTIVVGG